MATRDTKSVKLSASQEHKLLRQIRKNYDSGLNSRGNFPTRHAERYQRYLADVTTRPPGPWPDAAKLFIPHIRDVMEANHASIYQTLWGNPDHLKLKPFGEEDVPKTELATRFLHWTLSGVVPFLTARQGLPAITYTSLFDALLDGASVLKIYPTTPPYTPPTKDAKRYLGKYIQIDHVDLGQFIVPTDAEGLQYPQSRYVAQELWRTWDDLQRMKARGYEVPDQEDQFEKGRTREWTDRRRQEAERNEQTLDMGEGFWTLAIESYERFRLEDKGGLEEDVIVTWLPDAEESKSLMRVVRLADVFPVLDRPYRPFFNITLWPQPRQWMGLNVPDRLKSLQNVLNRLHEQCINYGELSMLPFYFYNAYMTGDLPDLRTVRPGQGVPVMDPAGIQFSPSRSMNRHFVELIQLFQAAVERDTHTNDFSMGRQADRPNTPRTLGATALIMQAGKQAFTPIIKHLGGQYGDALNFFFALWQAFMPNPTWAPTKLMPGVTKRARGLRCTHGGPATIGTRDQSTLCQGLRAKCRQSCWIGCSVATPTPRRALRRPGIESRTALGHVRCDGGC